MKPVLPLFVFIDACGWEIVKTDPFLRSLAPRRKRLDSVLGYSSACVPSIVSGRWPAEHRNWSYFVYDPERSPFRWLWPLSLLPRFITSRRRFRRALSKFLKRRLGFKGYFDLYNLPFRDASRYDFTEKKSPLRPGGMNAGKNIFDFLEERAIPYHVSDPDLTEEANLAALIDNISSESIDFGFLYWPGLDGLLHSVGNRSPQVPEKLRQYERWIHRLIGAARRHYSEVRLYVFSDHGMANCEETLNLKPVIDALPLESGRDYAVVYDSTMARFWFFNSRAKWLISEALGKVRQGRILPDGELEELGVLFPDRYFGELFFLVKEGVLIVPSHMGARPIRAMHGYHPTDKHSYALLCTNQESIPEEVSAIPDMYKLMTRDAEAAHAANSQPLGAEELSDAPRPLQPEVG
ncbi:MAG TPA: alkaline phosphatase family protein [Verrucomicrobiae bacterium]|nr:alkaline phosphatase family protein [Verrucomicrobiae bacterium]